MDGQRASPQTTCTLWLLLRLALALWLGVMAAAGARAERLSVKVFTIADGLISNKISRIVRDSRGFLWFCTEEGLSKFDGYKFTNYTTEQGLPDNWVDDLLETRGGEYWVATERGLCKFNPKGAPIPQTQIANRPGVAPMFTVWRPSDDHKYSMIRSLFEDRAGRLWVGAWRGFYRVEEVGGQVKFHQVELKRPADYRERFVVRSILEDEAGNLWLGASQGLYRLSPDGQSRRYTTADGLTSDNITGLVKDKQGRLWVGAKGICQIVPTSDAAASDAAASGAGGAVVIRRIAAKEISSCPLTDVLFQSADGNVWIGTECGPLELSPDSKEARARLDVEAMSDTNVWALGEDLNGNLWAGTPAGAIRIARSGFATYREKDGLGGRFVRHVSITRDGEIVVFSDQGDNYFIATFDGQRFIPRRFNPPQFALSDTPRGTGIYQDREGDWWVSTSNGLRRFPKANSAFELASARPVAHYTVKDGLPHNEIFGLYEDRRGDLWLATPFHPKQKVVRWERATGAFHSFSDADGLPSDEGDKPQGFGEDNEGNIWIAYRTGEIARFRHGRFELISSATGTLGGRISQLLRDSAGRIWIAGEKYGLRRVDNPTADRSQLIVQSFTAKLSSNLVYCIEEESPDRFHVGTSRGLNYLDLRTGSVRRFTAEDGLIGDEIRGIRRDHRGGFWFIAYKGLSRLLPRERRPQPPIFINRLLIADREEKLSALGERELSGLELSPNRNQIEIEFASLAFDGGDTIQYQYKLEGADADWSGYTLRRSVNYANLKPGDYRFLVRAVNSEGALSVAPASAQFTVLAPFWQRWWFILLICATAGLAIYRLYRYRVAQLLEIERVRTRIATDLHDDIGVNLSLISMVSDLARGTMRDEDRQTNGQMATWLSLIADTSRGMVDSMSDLVWAINPEKDRLDDLTQRMQLLAADLFNARNITFTFPASDKNKGLKLGVEMRREVFLIFKESVNNIVRHAQCTAVNVEFQVEQDWLRLTLRDNGRGFDPNCNVSNGGVGGNGLASMRRRALKLGGEIEVDSAPGRGATVNLRAPIHKYGFRDWRFNTGNQTKRKDGKKRTEQNDD